MSYENITHPKGRRIMQVTPEAIVSLGCGMFEVTKNALPKDVRVCGGQYDQRTHTIAIVLESADWPAIPMGGVLPVIAPPEIRAVPMIAVMVPAMSADQAERFREKFQASIDSMADHLKVAL